MPPFSAAFPSYMKFIELAKRPYIYSILIAFLITSLLSILSVVAFSQPLIHQNGQPRLKGLDAGMHIDSPTRRIIDLAGSWQYSFDGEKWKEIKIPSSVDYEGQMIFRRTFAVDEELISNSSFKFIALGVNYECEVYLNEIFIGKHVGGYTSFEYEVPEDVIQMGKENLVKVVVSNRLSAYNTLPVRKQVWGWKNYCGILRDIYILATPKLWVDRIRVHTSFDQHMKQAVLRLNGVVSSKQFSALNRDSLLTKQKQSAYFFNAELYERFSALLVAQGTSDPLTLESNKNTDVQLSFTMNEPKLWSPDNPELYILKTSIISTDGKQKTVIDQYSLNIGFSSLSFEKRALVLNGNKITLKGVVWQEDSPNYGASLSYEQMEKDIVLVKSLGANAIRFAFHPPHPYMLNLCSRYGLVVFEEIPVWNVPAEILNEELFLLMAETQTREMIERDGTFPCILAWGIGDQFDSASEQAGGFVQRIAGVIRQLDDRPVYYGTRMLKNDVCSSFVDFIGIVLPPTDLKNFRRLLSEWKKDHAAQAMILLSYGKEVDQKNRNGYSDPMSQESQARFYLQYYAALKEANVAGSFTAALADWRGDRPLLNFGLSDRYLHPVGLLNQTRDKRLSYEIVRALYNGERISAIPAGNFRMSFPWAHVLIGLFVIILIGYESTNRRFAESLKRSLVHSYNFFVDLRDLHTVSIQHTLILSCAVSCTLAGLLSNIMYHYRGDRFADYIITYLFVLDPIKEQFIYATWHPFIGIAILSGLFLLLGGILTLFIKLFALFAKTHVSWLHMFSILAWGATPVIILSPLAMSLFKIMGNPSYIIPSLVIILLVLLWVFFRVLKGVSIVCDLSPAKTYTFGILLCVFLFGGVFLYYDSVYALSSYIKFIVHLAQNIG